MVTKFRIAKSEDSQTLVLQRRIVANAEGASEGWEQLAEESEFVDLLKTLEVNEYRKAETHFHRGVEMHFRGELIPSLYEPSPTSYHSVTQ